MMFIFERESSCPFEKELRRLNNLYKKLPEEKYRRLVNKQFDLYLQKLITHDKEQYIVPNLLHCNQCIECIQAVNDWIKEENN